MPPSWKIQNLRRRVNRARKFPDNTCSSSRHLHIMADRLASGKQYFMFAEEPEHCAMSIYAVLESLWKARTELARLKNEQPNVPVKPARSTELLGGCMEQIDIEVWQDGMCVAKVSAYEVDAMREAAHYAMVYGQDGPVEVFRVKRGKRNRIAEISSAT